MEPVLIGCSAGCGKKIENPASWEFLHITGRYRCWECSHALAGVTPTRQSQHVEDTLPPNSIGALKKLSP